MTVTTTLDRQYFDGDGSNKVFPFNFRFFTNDQIYVSLIAPDGTITLQNLTTNYTLSGALQAGGGTVTMLIAPPLTVPATRVFVQRILPQVQPTSIRNQGKFYPEIHEDAFDRLTMLIQQALAGVGNSLQLTFGKTGWNFLGYKGINVGAPTQSTDAATKGYVDTSSQGNNAYADAQILRTVRGGAGEVLTQLPPAASRANKVMGFDASGNPIGVIPASGSATELAIDLANDVDPNKGAGMIGFEGTRLGQYLRALGPLVSIEDTRFNGGAKGDGVTSDAKAIQMALNYVSSLGGGRVFVPVPAVEYLCDYPVFVWSNTELFGVGSASIITFLNPTFAHGRGGIVIGSSLEANRELAMIAYANNTYPGATTNNPAYVNLPLGTYLRDNPAKIETRESSVHDLTVRATWNAGAGWGGYGINFVNAWNCHAWNIFGQGWTQMFGMGSDVAPETPSNHMCTAFESHVVSPDPVRTYYAFGFMANSTNCHFHHGYQHKPCTGTTEGNMAAANQCEDSSIQHMYCADLGKIGSSAGVYVADCRDFLVDHIYIGNAKRAAQSFFFNAASIVQARPIVFGKNIVGTDCDVVISIGTKYTRVGGFFNINCTYDIEFFNSNVTGCVVEQKPLKINYGAGFLPFQYFDNNLVEGWRPSDIYLRPADILINDKADTSSWDTNKRVATKAGVKLSFLWHVPPHVTAIRSFVMFTTYAGDAQTAGMSVVASIRKMSGFNGNTAEAAIILQTIAAPATNTSTLDRQLTSSTDLVIINDATVGLPNSHDLLIEFNSPTVNSSLKETRVRCYM